MQKPWQFFKVFLPLSICSANLLRLFIYMLIGLFTFLLIYLFIYLFFMFYFFFLFCFYFSNTFIFYSLSIIHYFLCGWILFYSVSRKHHGWKMITDWSWWLSNYIASTPGRNIYLIVHFVNTFINCDNDSGRIASAAERRNNRRICQEYPQAAVLLPIIFFCGLLFILLADCRNCWPAPPAAQDCRNFPGDIVFYLAFFGVVFFFVAPGVDCCRMINGDKKKIYSVLFFFGGGGQ